MTNVPCHCDNCGEEYNPANPFYIFDRVENTVEDTQSFCESCGDDLKDEMKADGWIRDDDDDDEPLNEEIAELQRIDDEIDDEEFSPAWTLSRDPPKTLAEAMTMIMECEAKHEKAEAENEKLEEQLEEIRDELENIADEGLHRFDEDYIFEYVSEMDGYEAMIEGSTAYIALEEKHKKLKEEKARRGYRYQEGVVSWCKDEEIDELEKLKNVCRLEDGRPFTIEGDRFNSGDIFEYAADCHGFQEFVEATPFYEELADEFAALQ